MRLGDEAQVRIGAFATNEPLLVLKSFVKHSENTLHFLSCIFQLLKVSRVCETWQTKQADQSTDLDLVFCRQVFL